MTETPRSQSVGVAHRKVPNPIATETLANVVRGSKGIADLSSLEPLRGSGR